MRFSKLSEYFEKLEATSSRLVLIDILSNLFKDRELSKDELPEVIYLLQGRIAPFFEPVEIGMAEKNVASAMAKSYSLSKDEILKLYAKLGDMGFVALSLASKRNFKKHITVMKVVEILSQIAAKKGPGTVEDRQDLLSSLLDDLDPISSKHLVRIPLGNTRLGIGDPTILDALALSELGDKSKRKLLEGAYNRTSNLGLIAQTLRNFGLKGVEALKIKVGSPIRSELCERLPTPEKVIEKLKTVNAQYKYDGFRVQIHKMGNDVRMFSRNLEEMTNMFPELIIGSLEQIQAKNAILDSEALAYNPESQEFLPFQETTKRRRKYNIEEMQKSLPLKAFIFDILYLDGRSLIDIPLSERMEILQKTVKSGNTLIPSPGKIISDAKELKIMLDDAISKGLEGLVVKRTDSLYEAGGRNFNWVKLKRHSAGELHDTIDCVILGYIYGRGKRTEFGAGALLVGLYDDKKDEFVTVSKIGTGLSDDEWREIHKRADKIKVSHRPARVNSLIEPSVWIEPRIVIEVLADEITRSPVHTAGKTESEPGYALRFPRLVSFRNSDKRSEDSTTVKELVEMYKDQTKK